MKQTIITADVLDNTEIAPGIFRMGIHYPEAADRVRPGQFFNIYPDADRLILPRPFGVHAADRREQVIYLIYEVTGEGTREMAEKSKGAKVRVSGPLGNGFDLQEAREGAARENRQAPVQTVLIGGGVGTSVLQLLAEELLAAGTEVTAVLGFRKHPFGAEELRKTGARVLVSTDLPQEGVYHGNVCGCMEHYGVTGDLYFACGPRPMLKAVDEYVRTHGDDRALQVSLESRMACGYGVCLGCSTPMLEEQENGQEMIVRKRVCKDGPVFRGNEVVW